MFYLDLLEDKDVLHYYNLIENEINNCPIDHSINHIKRTIDNAEILANLIGLSESKQQILFSACVLHDIGYIKSRNKHAMIGSLMCKRILNKHGYTTDDIEVVSSIIASHNSLKIEDYDLDSAIIMMLADKLDLSQNRLNLAYYSIDNQFKALTNIDYISFKLNDDSIEIYLNCKAYTSIKLLNQCVLISKLDNYLSLASKYLNINFSLKYNIKKVLTK